MSLNTDESPTKPMELLQGGSFAIGHHSNILFQFESATKSIDARNAKAAAASPTTTNNTTSFGNIAPWGDSNLFPQDVKDIILKNNTLSWCFRQITLSTYASGLRVRKKVVDPVTKVETIEDATFPEWEEFKRRNRKLNVYQMQKFRDLQRFGLSPVEFINEGDKIVGIKAHKAVQFRRSLMNDDGISDTAFLNAEWEKGKKEESENTIVMNIVPDDFDAVDLYRLNRDPEKNDIYVIQVPSDETYYPIMDWTSIIKSGWLEISNNEPLLVQAIIQNKAIINYVIKIKDWYWAAKYGKDAWAKYSLEQKRSKRQETIEEFNTHISSLKNAGKTILMDVVTQLNEDIKANVQGKQKNLKDFQDAWELIVVPQNDFAGSLKVDADTARKETMLAVGLDVSSFGSVPEQNHQGGSGKSQSMNILMIVSEFMRQLSVMDLEFIRDFNGWDPSMIFSYELPQMQTTANIPPDKRDFQAKQ